VKKLISIATIIFQIFIAFVVLFVIYIIFALLDMNDFDFANGVGFLIFQPLYGFIFSALTIAVCITVGLPIRLIPKLFKWWSLKPIIVFVGVIIGLILLIISLNSHFTETTNVTINGEQTVKQIPNITLALTGWFLTAFCLLHFYPLTIIKWFKTKVLTKQVDKNVESLV
jgi:hypothetical protein